MRNTAPKTPHSNRNAAFEQSHPQNGADKASLGVAHVYSPHPARDAEVQIF